MDKFWSINWGFVGALVVNLLFMTMTENLSCNSINWLEVTGLRKKPTMINRNPGKVVPDIPLHKKTLVTDKKSHEIYYVW